jgi:IS5 family transposase
MLLQIFVSSLTKTPQTMLGLLPEKGQHDLFRPMLKDFIDMNQQEFGKKEGGS